MTDRRITSLKAKRKASFWELGMTASLIGLILRIPLARIIGNEGNGYLAFSWELYIVFSLFFGYSLQIVIKDMVKRRVQRNQYHNSSRVLLCGISAGFGISVLGGLLIYGLSNLIFVNFYQMKIASISFRVFCVYLVLSTLSGCFQGYFEGMGTMVPTYFSRIIEAVIGGTGTILFAAIFAGYGEKVGRLLFNQQYRPGIGAAGVVCGLICGMAACFLFLLIIHRVYQEPLNELLRKDGSRFFESYGSILKEFFSLMIIFTIPALFLKSYRMVNLTIYIKQTALEEQLSGIGNVGSYYGKVALPVFIVVVLILGFSSQNNRQIKKFIQLQKMGFVRRTFLEDIKRIFLIALSVTVAFAVGAPYILKLIYGDASQYEVTMFQICSVNIVIMTLAVYGYLLLNSLNKNLEIMVISFIAFVLQTLAMIIALRTKMADYSFVIAEVVFWLAVLIVGGLYLTKFMEFAPGKNK